MAKAIMVQGTMSNAGKSVVAAGLCRVLHQDGYRVAPFKSQNMALNSFITKQGDEMGRAQVMQAEAAGIEPCVAMNPILLKPTSDSGSQVIVQGKAIGTMPAAVYYSQKARLRQVVLSTYNQLAARYERIVLEGAGSPAEINLQKDDLVNMGMAHMAKAPVLLVGDIDRGGVFASLYGTVMLLPPEDRKLIKGIIINKFRGDVALLKPGLKQLEEKLHIPVLGVLPMLNLDLEDEDSLSERLSNKTVKAVDIAVIRLPRISNYTDFNNFSRLPDVSLRYVSSVRELGQPDLLILPGTKNTIDDLLWLRQNGLEAALKKLAARGTPLFGVCGGYQMLGQSIADPEQVEAGGTVAGLNLLPVTTVFARDKHTVQNRGHFGQVQGIFKGLTGLPCHGYEIHAGVTCNSTPAYLTYVQEEQKAGDEQGEGAQNVENGYNVYGTYFHGLFEATAIVLVIVNALKERKGLKPEKTALLSWQAYKEAQYDKLAAGIRQYLDLERIYQIIEEGV